MDDHSNPQSRDCHTGAVAGMAAQATITRSFTRSTIADMGERPFMIMHEHAVTPVVWNDDEDTLEFEFTELAWCWVVLQCPELIDQYQR